MKSLITKKEINKIQKFTVRTLRNSGKKGDSLGKLSKDNCSEISRLTGCFIMEFFKDIAVYVIKGDRVFGRKQFHDVLVIQNKEDVYILDTSIWQFFPRKKSILVGMANNLQDSLKVAERIYKGKWKISEKLSLKKCLREKEELISIIRQNNG